MVGCPCFCLKLSFGSHMMLRWRAAPVALLVSSSRKPPRANTPSSAPSTAPLPEWFHSVPAATSLPPGRPLLLQQLGLLPIVGKSKFSSRNLKFSVFLFVEYLWTQFVEPEVPFFVFFHVPYKVCKTDLYFFSKTQKFVCFPNLLKNIANRHKGPKLLSL